MSLATLNEYILCELFKYLPPEDLLSLREASQHFYKVGKIMFLEKFSKSGRFLKTNGKFSYKYDTNFDITKNIKDIFVEMGSNGEYLITLYCGKSDDKETRSILKTVFESDVFKPEYGKLLFFGLNKGFEMESIIKMFPNFHGLEIYFRSIYNEDDDPTDYSFISNIERLYIYSRVPYKLAKVLTKLKVLHFLDTYSEYLIKLNSETLEELVIDHFAVKGPLGYQEVVDMDFQIKSRLKVFTAIGVRCLWSEEFLENQPDAEVNYVMCFSVNGIN